MRHNMIPISQPALLGNEKKYLEECVESGWVSSAGHFIKDFEKKNCEYYNMQYAVAVSNGTVALHLALLALGIGSGDEVIVPALTFVASINAVFHTGATPVLADVEPDSWTIDIDRCHSLITPKTKAIMPVHLYGQPCDMDKTMAFAKKFNLYVIEDCAEAHGAEVNGKKVGSFGDISCFSFYGNKIITTGEGGICLSNNESLFNKMVILRDHGMSKTKRFWYDLIGYNYRMTNMQAAIGVAQIEKISEYLLKREEISNLYDNFLKDIPFLSLQKNISGRKKVCWLYSVLIDIDKLGMSVEKVSKKLTEMNVDNREFFQYFPGMIPYKNLIHNDLKNSFMLSKTGINLPTFHQITPEEINYICNCLINLKKRYNDSE